MAANVHGCPGELCGSEGDVDAGVKRWEQILDEIATGFEMLSDDSAVLAERPPEIDRALALVAEWWEHLWD
jgi:hypothetical protein